MDIINCTEHMAEGRRKDVNYVAANMKPTVEKVGSQNAVLFAFDGAYNVQKAGLMGNYNSCGQACLCTDVQILVYDVGAQSFEGCTCEDCGKHWWFQTCSWLSAQEASQKPSQWKVRQTAPCR